MPELYTTKQCKICGFFKSLSDYHKSKRSPDGVRSDCKECRREIHLNNYQYAVVVKKTHCPQGHLLTEGNLRLGKRVEKGRRECLTCHRESGRRRYWVDPETRRSEGRNYARQHKNEAKLRLEKWNNENKEYARAVKKVNRGLRRVGSNQTSLDYIQILLKDPCCYCGGKAIAIDHIQPITKSGDSRWENLTPACTSCNSSKGNRKLLMYLWRVNKERLISV